MTEKGRRVTGCEMRNRRVVFRLVPNKNGRYLRSEAAASASKPWSEMEKTRAYIAVHSRLLPAPLLCFTLDTNALEIVIQA